MKLIDSSVLIMYLAREEGWRAAREILREAVHTVELAFKEVANALWKKNRLGEVEGEIALELLKKSRGLVSSIGEKEFLDKALEIAIQHKITVYDALYLAAALSLNAEFITADREQARVAEKLGLRVTAL